MAVEHAALSWLVMDKVYSTGVPFKTAALVAGSRRMSGGLRTQPWSF
jgi:hypothetical protein